MNFNSEFKKLTEFEPLRWQCRLFVDHLALGTVPAAVDIPTGLGKTAVMAIWYLALKGGARLPRRLVYVVDRRAVVDQATTVADEIKTRSGDETLRLSTLRGQHVDNREWLEDPAVPAIIVGTVDMIGSRLLFSGYGVSSKMRPYHAGLLGADTLVVLDESHLVPPFEKLLEAIETGPVHFGPRDETDRQIVPPFKLVSLSATGRARREPIFRLDEKKGDLDDGVVKGRLGAKKYITTKPGDVIKLDQSLAEQAWALSDQGKNAVRILVYCDRRDIAKKVKKAIEAKAKGDTNSNIASISIETELFVGARRVAERIIVAQRLKELGFLAGSSIKLTKPAFLISTSAGEVGIDLDADHMVCDVVPWERMVQRLGRVNRRGHGNAQVVVIQPEPSPDTKERKSLTKKENGEQISEDERKLIDNFERKLKDARNQLAPLLEPIKVLPKTESGIDASPGALRDLKRLAETDSELQHKIEIATSPPSLYPALSRALVDAWSMTSLEKHAGRPEVTPWLRGWIEDNDPRTIVVWRKHLPVRIGDGEVSKKEIEEFFEAAPPHMSEMLETESWRVGEWMIKRVDAWKSKKPEVGEIIAFSLSAAGQLNKFYQPEELYKCNDDKERNQQLVRELAGATLVIDSQLGGLKDGLLDYDADAGGIRTADDGGDWPADVHFRIRVVPGDETLDSGARITCIFPKRRSVEGEDTERLLIVTDETEESRSASTRPQLLNEHHSWTEQRARRISEAIGLTGNYAEYAEALAIAARLHDEGKKAARWQRAFNARQDGIYAKTRGPLIHARLGGYRHEFGSLPHAERDEAFKRLPAELQELVLHLIAAHHGRARPVIETEGCDEAPPSLLVARAREVALRFARLQKRWGPWGLAWWEALLRAADQQASRENDERGAVNGRS